MLIMKSKRHQELVNTFAFMMGYICAAACGWILSYTDEKQNVTQDKTSTKCQDHESDALSSVHVSNTYAKAAKSKKCLHKQIEVVRMEDDLAHWEVNSRYVKDVAMTVVDHVKSADKVVIDCVLSYDAPIRDSITLDVVVMDAIQEYEAPQPSDDEEEEEDETGLKKYIKNLNISAECRQVVESTIVEYELDLDDVKTLTMEDLCDMEIDKNMAKMFCDALNDNDGVNTELKELEKEENERKSESKLARVGGVIGLQNLGNTCFMNSALQCLLHTPALMNELIDVSTNCGNGNIMDNSIRSRSNSFYLALLEMVIKVHVDDGGKNRKCSISPRALHDMLGKQDSTLVNGKQNDCGHALSMMLHGLETSMPDKFIFNDKLAKDKQAHNLYSFEMKDNYFSKNYKKWDENNLDLQFVEKLITSNKLGLSKNLITKTFHLIETIVKTCLNCGFEERNYMESSELTLPVSDSYILLPIFYFKNCKINRIEIRLPYDATIELTKFVSLFKIVRKQGLGEKMSNYCIVKLKIGNNTNNNNNSNNNRMLHNFGAICYNSQKITKCFGIEKRNNYKRRECGKHYIHNNYVAFLVNKKRLTSNAPSKGHNESKKRQILYLDTCVEKTAFFLQVMNVDDNVKESELTKQLVESEKLLSKYDFYLNGEMVSGGDDRKFDDNEYILQCHKEGGVYRDDVNELNVLVRVERILGMDSSNHASSLNAYPSSNTNSREDIIAAVIEGCLPLLVDLTPMEITHRMRKEMPKNVSNGKFKNEILIAYSRIGDAYDGYDKSLKDAEMVLKKKINQFVTYVSTNKLDVFFNSVFEKELKSLKECFDVYGKRVIGIGQQCDFFTNSCQCKSQNKFISTKRKITRGPLILTIKLDRTNAQSKKQQTHIQFGEALNLNNGDDNDDNYDLYAISKHSGSTGKFGHYWANVKRLGTNEWWNCNDSSCYQIGTFTCDNAILIMYQTD